jgi:hypothetical protein
LRCDVTLVPVANKPVYLYLLVVALNLAKQSRRTRLAEPLALTFNTKSVKVAGIAEKVTDAAELLSTLDEMSV